MQWVHPAFDGSSTQRELAGCRQQAWIESQHLAFAYGMGPRWPYPPGRRNSPFGWTSASFMDRQMLEMQLADFCMRNKGFALVPVS